jgi:thymidylate kinase
MPEHVIPVARQAVVLAGVFAVVGCDGTGKSTLSLDLLKHLRAKGSAERRYLGLVSGEMGDKIKTLPWIGVKLEDSLHRKANRALDMEKPLPGVGTSIIMYLLSIWRSLLLWRVIRLSRKGTRIIADRYPQVEIPGFHYDGPGLTQARTDNWLVRKLAAREQQMYQWMARHKPALVIRLNIDAEEAHARKPDHDLAELRDKIAIMPRITFNGATLCEIDTTMPYPQVLAAAIKAIDNSH